MNLRKQRSALIVCLALSLTLHLLYGLEGAKQMDALEYQLERQAAQLKDKNQQIEVLEIIIKNQEVYQEIQQPECLGAFEITYYTAGYESTGKTPTHPEYGITASGAYVKEGQTIAADWDVLKPGTKVYIDGIGERIVEDKGGAIKDKCIDVYVEDVNVARQLGRHKAEVWLVEDEI